MRQISHDFALPTCADGHAARHMHDLRGAPAGGGHFIECQCRKTTRHADLEPAMSEWCRLNGKRKPRKRKAEIALPNDAGDNLLQFRLPLQRSAGQ